VKDGEYKHPTSMSRFILSTDPVEPPGITMSDLQVADRGMELPRTGVGACNVRLAVGLWLFWGLSNECSLTLLRLGVRVFLVGVGGASPSMGVEKSRMLSKSVCSSPSKLRTLPRRALLEALPRWKIDIPLPALPKL
jgi:hypothetical protein